MLSFQALKELLEEIEPLLKTTVRIPSSTAPSRVDVSAKSAVTVSDSPTPDDDWLTGTNIGVTKKVYAVRI